MQRLRIIEAFVIGMLMNMATHSGYADALGQERYIEAIRATWINTSWWMWAIVWMACVIWFVAIMQSARRHDRLLLRTQEAVEQLWAALKDGRLVVRKADK